METKINQFEVFADNYNAAKFTFDGYVSTVYSSTAKTCYFGYDFGESIQA